MALVEQKMGGPYSSKERKQRRERVAELYFERGYHVTDIAEKLNVSRNTISDDLKLCFSQLRNEYDDFNYTTICMTQFHRMGIQRRRLMDLLQTETKFSNRMALEKMITDIENKIMQAALKIDVNYNNIQTHAIDMINIWAKEQNPTFRVTPHNQSDRISIEAQDKIDKIIEEDLKNTQGFTLLNQGAPSSNSFHEPTNKN